MKMRKDAKPVHSDSALFNALLNPLQAFDPPTGIERVLVFPIRDVKRKIVKDSYVLIFGYGEIIRRGVDLVVAWNDRKGFGYLPFEVKPINLKKVPHSDRDTQEEHADQVRRIAQGFSDFFRSQTPRARHAFQVGVEDIKQAVKSGQGFWRSHNRKLINQKLTKEYIRFDNFGPLSGVKTGVNDKFLQQDNFWIKRFLEDGGARVFFLLLRDVLYSDYQLKATMGPDPYAVVRKFLRCIGLYPVRQSGNKRRKRLKIEDELELKKYLKNCYAEGKSPVPSVKQAFAALELQQPSKHLIKKYEKFLSKS